MAAWHTLSGYLALRPGGALARLKGRRKRWYIFDENSCCLYSFKSELDAGAGKQPTSTIDLRNAAISFLVDEEYGFVIYSDCKEYVFVADSHESMMMWVMALQQSRDLCRHVSDRDIKPVSEKICVTRKISLPAKMSLEESSSNQGGENHDPHHPHGCRGQQERRLSLQHNRAKMWQVSPLSTITHSSAMEEEEDIPKGASPVEYRTIRPPLASTSSSEGVSSTLSSTLRGSQAERSCGAKSARSGSSGRPHHRRAPLRRMSHQSSAGVTSGCDSDSDSMDRGGTQRDCGGFSAAMRERIRYLRSMANSDSSRDTSRQDRTGSLSGNSVSSDSAIGHGDSALSLRLHELETELMATKCELAKALNRETVQKNALIEQEGLVSELHQQIRCLESSSEDPKKGCSVQRLNDKCCMLESHNRFLNEEVLKLSKRLQQQQCHSVTYQNCLHDQEMEIDQLKRDYVFLMQSAIRIRSMEGPEVLEVYLYGGDKHAARVLQLLREARMSNPSLPIYDSQNKVLQHTDSLGFKHNYTEESLALHYICRQLHLHYQDQLPSSSEHLRQWRQYLFMNGEQLVSSKELKMLVRQGIPVPCRRQVWRALFRCRVADIIEDKGRNYYRNLCCRAPESEVVSQNKRQISLDLLRTLPQNVRFSSPEADGIRKLQEVLQAFCLHNPSLGYCQGMNFLVGMCLLFMEPEDAFWCLVAITERYFTPNYFDHSLVGAQADQEVLKSMLRDKLPRLQRHLTQLDIELCTVTLNWFLAIFFDSVPFETLLRIWDCFLLEGPKVLFRFSLAILKMHEEALLTKTDTVSIMRQLKAIARLCYDVDTLIKVAFEDLELFPRRQDIAAKQACYQKALREQSKKREMEKQNVLNNDRLAESGDSLGENTLIIECAAACDTTTIWVCHASANLTRLSRVNCEDSVMYRLNINIEARVICMHFLGGDTMLLGTLSHFVYSYSTRTREMKWEVQLNDSVLSLCSYEEDEQCQVFAGLADGTMAVIENFATNTSRPDTLYIHIGSSPVTCIRLVDKRLWCAAGNRIVILSARTLDTVDQFQVSSSSLDYISVIQPCSIGESANQSVWLSLRGSSVLQLWDAHTLTCKMLYDVREDRYPRSPRQDEEGELNQARITAVLPMAGSVLVGTAEGFLVIYDVVPRIVGNDFKTDSSSDGMPAAGTFMPLVTPYEHVPKLDLEPRARNDSGYLTATTPMAALTVTSALTDSKSDDNVNDTSGSQHSFTTVVRKSAEYLSSSTKSLTDEDAVRDVQPPEDLPLNGHEDSTVVDPFSSLLDNGLSQSPGAKSEEKMSICPVTELCSREARRWSLKTTDSCPAIIDLQGLKKRTSWGNLHYQILKRRNSSADCLPTWLSRDTLSSSLTSDSYDFDDFFVQYNDDGLPAFRETEVVVEYGSTQATAETMTVPSVYLSVEEANGALDHGSVWTENEDGGDSSTTHGAATNDWPEVPSYDVSHLSSDLGSNVSFSSIDPPYGYELVLQEKLKISDKAIRCLLELRCKEEPLVISGAGCYGDDESVLKWTKDGGERLWTNDPVVEVCPYTNTIKPSPYTRSRLPRKVSETQCSAQQRTIDLAVSNGSATGGGAHHLGQSKSHLEPPKRPSSMGARLARMHSIFAKGVEKD